MDTELMQFTNALFLALLSLGAAIWYRFYTLPKGPAAFKGIPNFFQVFLIFIVFFTLQIIVIPAFAYIGMLLFSAQGITLKSPITDSQQSWLYIPSIYLASLLIWFFAKKVNPQFIRSMTGFDRSGDRLGQNAFDFSIGSLTWLLSFPLVMVLGMILQEFVEYVFHPPEVDQVAVQVFKNSFKNPWLFALTFIGMVIPVPIAEELLFRGYFQQWLKTKVSLPWAIISTSLLFASVHFSSTHGWHNLELMPTLFLLSCFLGFLVERQQSLWASIGLHATFNLISVLAITLQVEGVSA